MAETRTIEAVVAEMTAVVDGVENRAFTDDEATRYEELEKELAALRKSHEIRSRQQAYTTPVRQDVHVHVATDEPSLEQRAFTQYMRTATVSPELAEVRAQSEGVGSAGGYLVPDLFRQQIIERRKSFGGLQNVVQEIVTDSGAPIEWPTLDDTANQGEIVPENAQAAGGADLVFGTAQLGAYKYESTGAGGLPLKLSWELVQDAAFDVEAMVSRVLATRIARKQAVHWATGTGVNQPKGILTGVTATKTIANNTTGPTYPELVSIVHSLDPEYRQGARWVMNDATAAKVESLVDANNRPLWNVSTASISGQTASPTLLGYPVTIDQGFPDPATNVNFLLFGDTEQAYVIRRVKGFSLAVARELYMTNGQIGYIGWERADGAIQNANAFVVAKGV